MARTVPLLIQIAVGDSRPIGRQIADAVRRKIAVGELPEGAQLPSVRALAEQLTINANTVAKAYSDLAAEGWLDSRPGLGVFVAAPRQLLSDAERERRLDDAIQRFIDELIALNVSPEEAYDRLGAELAALVESRTA
jgi:GntR family transcriptional regulator